MEEEQWESRAAVPTYHMLYHRGVNASHTSPWVHHVVFGHYSLPSTPPASPTRPLGVDDAVVVM